MHTATRQTVILCHRQLTLIDTVVMINFVFSLAHHVARPTNGFFFFAKNVKYYKKNCLSTGRRQCFYRRTYWQNTHLPYALSMYERDT